MDDCSRELSHDLVFCLHHWRKLGPTEKDRLRSTRRAFERARNGGSATGGEATAREREYVAARETALAHIREWLKMRGE